MNKGFSLVELIVVIAIMAILVGVAVPVYTGYIGSANEAKEKQYVGELEAAINTVYIEFLAEGKTVSTFTINDDGEITFTTPTADDTAFKTAVEKILAPMELTKATSVTVDAPDGTQNIYKLTPNFPVA